MIAGRFLLLVARVVLLIHDEKAKVFERRKHRRACAERDPGLATARAPPLLMTIELAQAAVKHRHPSAQARAVKFLKGGRQRDFRHQHQCRAVLRQAMADEAQVNFRLAAGRDAVKKHNPEFTLLEAQSQVLKGGGLRPRQLRPLVQTRGRC